MSASLAVSARDITLRDGRRVTVREVEHRDGPGMVALLKDVARECAFTLLEPDEIDERESAMLRDMGERAPNELRLLARSGESDADVIADLTIGAKNFRRIAHVAKLGMEIRKDYRGAGLGSAMLGMALAWARAHPVVARVELQVFAENAHAVALYRKFGFEVEGCRRKYMRVRERYCDDLVMGMFVKSI
jgi:RimJ/RimL family protein N-acetyltransferase